MVTSRRGGGADSSQPPPFLTKTYELVEDPSTNDVVSWSPTGASFVVWKPAEFARDLLPKHFKHNNFSSFVRQLNTYGFRKVDPDRWEFANENFLSGRAELLKGIHRRKAAAQPPQQPTNNTILQANTAIEIGQFGGLKDEVDNLKRDKNVLMLELVRLRQQQQWSEQEVHRLNRRLEVAENRQMEMLHLFTKFLQNPCLLSQMVSAANRQRLERTANSGGGRRKRRAPAHDEDVDMDGTNEENQIVQYHPQGSSSMNQEFSENLMSLLGSLADGTAFRSEPKDHTEIGTSFNPNTIGDGPDALVEDTKSLDEDLMLSLKNVSEENGPASSKRDSDAEIPDDMVALGIPVVPDGMSANQFLNQVGTSGQEPSLELPTSSPLPVPSLDGYGANLNSVDMNMNMNSATQPVVQSPFNSLEHGMPEGPPPDVSPFSMVNESNGLNSLDNLDDLVDGLASLGSTDLLMMDGDTGSLQRDESFWRNIFSAPSVERSNGTGGKAEGVKEGEGFVRDVKTESG